MDNDYVSIDDFLNFPKYYQIFPIFDSNKVKIIDLGKVKDMPIRSLFDEYYHEFRYRLLQTIYNESEFKSSLSMGRLNMFKLLFYCNDKIIKTIYFFCSFE